MNSYVIFEFQCTNLRILLQPLSQTKGTHVSGIVLAESGNNIGVSGILSSTDRICLLVARVFGGGIGSTANSNIDKSVEWCIANNAKVINMSLGSVYKSHNSEAIINRIAQEEDVLFVAAAGNLGKSKT